MQSEEERASELSFTHHYCRAAEKVKVEMLKGGGTFRPEVGQKSWEEHVPGGDEGIVSCRQNAN